MAQASPETEELLREVKIVDKNVSCDKITIVTTYEYHGVDEE